MDRPSGTKGLALNIAILGGGGVRAPMLVEAVASRADRIGIDSVYLFDTDDLKLETFGGIAREMARTTGCGIQVETTSSFDEAVADAQYVIATIRVGGEASRVRDEQIAISHGVLGQETTGAGGFAMALRSIPALVEYAQRLKHLNPDALLINFTNPAGIVTEALHAVGFDSAVGICDSANGCQNAVARWLGVDTQTVTTDVFGLNHLSWCRSAVVGGTDRLPELLGNPEFLNDSFQQVFDPGVIRQIGMWCNEYLYYYYHRDEALLQTSDPTKTRGLEVEAINRELIRQMTEATQSGGSAAALDVYRGYDRRRNEGYMEYALEHPDRRGQVQGLADGFEGYAGVALDVIEALETGRPTTTALNVANRGAIDGFRDSDVVEVSCFINGEGIRPAEIGEIPESVSLLAQTVKLYERLTVEAALTRSRATAVKALFAHPLVASYRLARNLVDSYLEAHRDHVGQWQ